MPQRVHNCPRANGIKKKLVCYSSNYLWLHKAPTSSQLPVTAAITLDFTILQRIHNCPRTDGIKKRLSRYRSNYPKLHKTPTSSHLSKSGCYLKKHVCYSSNYPWLHKPSTSSQLSKSGWYLKKLVCYSSNYHRLHKAPTSSQLSKSGWYLKKTCPLQKQLSSTSQSSNEFTIAQERMVLKTNLPATAAIILDFTKPQRIHNCPRADGIKKKLARYSSNYPWLHKATTSSQLSKSGWY